MPNLNYFISDIICIQIILYDRNVSFNKLANFYAKIIN